MSYAFGSLDELGSGPGFRKIRKALGVKAFGVNAWTGREAGDRIINEHDESQEQDLQEELYLVQRGRARFELDGERVDARRPARRGGRSAARSQLRSTN